MGGWPILEPHVIEQSMMNPGQVVGDVLDAVQPKPEVIKLDARLLNPGHTFTINGPLCSIQYEVVSVIDDWTVEAWRKRVMI